MFEFFVENMGTIIVGAILLSVACCIVVKLVRDKKAGKCCGCSSGCSQNCERKFMA